MLKLTSKTRSLVWDKASVAKQALRYGVPMFHPDLPLGCNVALVDLKQGSGAELMIISNDGTELPNDAIPMHLRYGVSVVSSEFLSGLIPWEEV